MPFVFREFLIYAAMFRRKLANKFAPTEPNGRSMLRPYYPRVSACIGGPIAFLFSLCRLCNTLDRLNFSNMRFFHHVLNPKAQRNEFKPLKHQGAKEAGISLVTLCLSG